MHLAGTPSDSVPAILATGATSIRYAFMSLSARDPQGRDGEYIAWHSLDHRPEQYRLPELRNSLRLVSTPACRDARAASHERFAPIDHVMTYLFTDVGAMPGFTALGAALDEAGRMPHRLPSVGYLTGELAGKAAAPRAVTGADVLPWRPARGVYLLVERGHISPEPLVALPGVAGVWWYHGLPNPAFGADAEGMQMTYCYLDEDPVEAAQAIGEAVYRRRETGAVECLFAAPFHTIVPFDWGRYVP